MTDVAPVNRLGILGAGQLGAMLAEAARRLGIPTELYDSSDDPAAKYLRGLTQGDFHDGDAIAQFASRQHLLTYEFENIPLEIVQRVAETTPVLPPPAALAASCDRLVEKKLLQSLGIATAKFVEIGHPDMLLDALQHIGGKGILKTRRFGYDGKGQWLLRGPEDLAQAVKSLRGSKPTGGYILEEWIAFQRELSVIAVRSQSGALRFYDLCENHHEGGILRWTKVADQVPDAVRDQAHQAAKVLAEKLSYVGTLVIEFFERDGQLIANEFAPRVHNSGHWTLTGAVTSQFENHIRAVADLPLGDTRTREFPLMVNCIGAMPDPKAVLELPVACFDYGKKPRAGRKVGHLNGLVSSLSERDELLGALCELCREPR